MVMNKVGFYGPTILTPFGYLLVMALKKNKYITRFDYVHTHGWDVRYHNKGQYEKPIQKFFADNTYGSKQQALKAALHYRDSLFKKLNLIDQLIPDFPKVTRRYRLNSSGIIGVSLVVCHKKTGSYYSYCAKGMLNHKFWQKHYSLLKYGEKTAFRLACEERVKRHGFLSISKNQVKKIKKLNLPYEVNNEN